MYNIFFHTLAEQVEQAYQLAWNAEDKENQDPLFICYPEQVKRYEELLETAREQWYKYAGDVKPDHLALATPEFAILAELNKAKDPSGIVVLVLGLLQKLCENNDLRMDTVVRVINEELTNRGQNA